MLRDKLIRWTSGLAIMLIIPLNILFLIPPQPRLQSLSYLFLFYILSLLVGVIKIEEVVRLSIYDVADLSVVSASILFAKLNTIF